jgi:hypothetical protein
MTIGFLDQWAQNLLDAQKPKPTSKPAPRTFVQPERSEAMRAVEKLASHYLRGFRFEVRRDPRGLDILLVVVHVESGQSKRYSFDERQAVWDLRAFAENVVDVLLGVTADMVWNPELPVVTR